MTSVDKINNTVFTGKFLIYEPVLDSTNDFARRLISKTNPMDGTVILTDNQRAGRGQGGNSWESEPGKNLTFSVIYDTAFLPVADQYVLNMAVAVAAMQALKDWVEADRLAIKWPNDLLAGGRKLGGILIENTLRGNRLRHSIIGMGINIGQREFPGLPHATSIARETGTDPGRHAVLERLCQALERALLDLRAGRGDQALAAYNRWLYRRGQEAAFCESGESFTAVVESVARDGRLLLRQGSAVRAVAHGAVRWEYDDGDA